jgi:hypothetical protein
VHRYLGSANRVQSLLMHVLGGFILQTNEIFMGWKKIVSDVV